MDERDQQLAEELRASLEQGGYRTAFENQTEEAADSALGVENPLESDFFKAINAFRAARSSGDKDAIDKAEEHLRDVVRGELTGE